MTESPITVTVPGTSGTLAVGDARCAGGANAAGLGVGVGGMHSARKYFRSAGLRYCVPRMALQLVRSGSGVTVGVVEGVAEGAVVCVDVGVGVWPVAPLAQAVERRRSSRNGRTIAWGDCRNTF
jgi:hypothetical protein